jgi:hypothetical protein
MGEDGNTRDIHAEIEPAEKFYQIVKFFPKYTPYE